MHADELRVAVKKILDILNRSEVQTVVRDYKTAAADQRTIVAARLGHAGAVLMENLARLDDGEKRVLDILHLDSLGQSGYWKSLLENPDPRTVNAELVRLYSRVMYARDHLPKLVELLAGMPAQPVSDSDAPSASMLDTPLRDGESRLNIRLTDAGERAADPDRVARAIDGIDMLYSACASMARKPAMDMRLDLLAGTTHRDLWFTGERDSVAAVIAVLASIPDVLDEFDPDDDIDLDDVVRALPVFADLQTLGTTGAFSNNDLKDIADTMHQGALLALESGVILRSAPVARVAPRAATSVPASRPAPVEVSRGDEVATEPAQRGEPPVLTRRPGVAEAEAGDATTGGDEHYERYLREREAMRSGGDASPLGNLVDSAAEDQKRRDAVEDMLRSLERARGK